MKQQLAKVQVPPHVLFPTPPATVAPNAKHADVTLHTWLQLPPPMNPCIAWAVFLQPPPTVDNKLVAVLALPPLKVE